MTFGLPINKILRTKPMPTTRTSFSVTKSKQSDYEISSNIFFYYILKMLKVVVRKPVYAHVKSCHSN